MEDENQNAILKELVFRALVEFSQKHKKASFDETMEFVNDFVNKYFPYEVDLEVKK